MGKSQKGDGASEAGKPGAGKSESSPAAAGESAGTNNGVAHVSRRLGFLFENPLRASVIQALCRESLCCSDLAKRIGGTTTTDNIPYHINLLVEWDCVRVVGEEIRRGKTVKIYGLKRGLNFSKEIWNSSNEAEKHRFMGGIIEGATTDVVVAHRSEVFEDHPESMCAWIPMDTDEEGWRQLTALAASSQREAERIQQESSARLADGGAPLSAVFTLFSHLMPDASESAAVRRQVASALKANDGSSSPKAQENESESESGPG